MLTVPLVGATFRPVEAKDIIRGLSIGDRVQLVADPNNEHDATAVAVYSDDVHIGFIPKESNSALFAVLMDGAQISAEIVAFENTLRPVLEIHFDSMPADEDGLSDALEAHKGGRVGPHDSDFDRALEPAPDGSFEQYEQ